MLQLPHFHNRPAALAGLRFRADAEHLHSLGDSRPLAEFFAELCQRHPELEGDLLALLREWRRLTPELVDAVGGNRWPLSLFLIRGGKS
jgi:hypothetical protein